MSSQIARPTSAWSQRLDVIARSAAGAAAGHQLIGTDLAPVELGPTELDDLGPLPAELRERAVELLAVLHEAQHVVQHRLDEIDEALRHVSGTSRSRGGATPAPAYLDHLA